MSIGREDYQERKEARIGRLEARAAAAEAESTAAFKSAREIMDHIPAGQPILVGHHSERGHRRDLARIDRGMQKSVEADEKARYYQGRAARLDMDLAEMREAIRRPVPAWQLSNRNAEITRLKKRIEALRKVDEMEHVEIDFEGGRIITNEEINRVQILFDEKPDEATRAKLKSNGFRWSPREGAWQAPRTPIYLRRAKYLLGIQED